VRRLFTVLLFLLLAAPAHAGVTVSTSTTQAGEAADVTIDASFASTPGGVVLELPAGLVGNPNAAAKCSQAAFEALGCLPNAQVGTATALGFVPGAIYNLQPSPGEPARLGISILGLIKNQAVVSLRPDGGLTSTIPRLNTGGLPLTSLRLTLDRDFMALPTSCGTHAVTLNGERGAFTTTG
jgi:hypothetical protein